MSALAKLGLPRAPTALFSGHGIGRFLGVGPGQEFVDPAVGTAIDYLDDDVAEVAERIYAIELAGFDQRRDGRPMFAAAIRASGSQPGLEGVKDRPASVLTNGVPLFGTETAGVLLDGIEIPNALKRLAGDRCRARAAASW